MPPCRVDRFAGAPALTAQAVRVCASALPKIRDQAVIRAPHHLAYQLAVCTDVPRATGPETSNAMSACGNLIS